MRIEVSIDDLVLHGVPASDRTALGHAVTRELERRLSQPGAAAAVGRAGSRPLVDGGELRVGPRLGTDLGAAVARALGGGRR
jgi:hypothetical protein